MRRARHAIVGAAVLTLLLGVVQVGLSESSGGGISLDGVRAALRQVLPFGDRDGARQSPRPAKPELAREQRAPVGKAAAPATRVRELTSRRTANAAFFQMSDGRIQAEVASSPRHYRDPAGRWQPIDTRVRPSGAGLANSTNTFASRFGTSTNRLVVFDLDGRRIDLGVAGPDRTATPVADGDKVRFAGAFGAGADLAYRVTPNGLKGAVVLDRAPADPTFTFTLNLRGVTARALRDGSIGFFAPERDTEPLLVMPRPFMYDAKADPQSPYGARWSPAVTQTLRTEGNRATITLRADRAWLADPARAYPVTVDPTIKIQPTVTQSQDAMITSDEPATNHDGNWRLSVGTTAASRARSLVRFGLSGIPAGTRLDSAQLQLYFDQDHTTGSFDVPMEARRVTSAWSESTVTWNSINTAMGEVGANVETVDDAETAKTAVNGAWSTASSTAAIQGGYRFNKNSVTGETFTWVPKVTEPGTYTVEAHYVAGTDRTTAAPYTVRHAGGSTARTVNQTTGTGGVWAGLGSYSFNAGTSHSVVLGDVSDSTKAVVADAVRLTKPGTVVKRAGESSVWHSYSVRSTVQAWLDGTQANNGFMLKAVDEATLGRGGPRYEAAEFAYNGENENTPKLILTYGKPGVDLAPPTKFHSTGAELKWSAYTGSDIVEYQVHRAVFQHFNPSAATLVAPVKPGTTTFTDSTATPTPVDSPDPFGQVYYYMIAVKTADGSLIPAPTQIARLPRAGRTVVLLQGDAADTTLSSTEATTGHDVLAGNPWLSVGNNSGTFGRTRAVVKFGDLSAIPAGARVVDASFQMWSVTTIPIAGATYAAHALTRSPDEATASWTKANATTNWTTPGGDFSATVADTVTGNTNDPAWREFFVDGIVQGWVNNPASNHGLLVKLANETSPAERTLFLSSEAAEPQLRPKLVVTYTERTAAQTYFVPDTPTIRMIPGDLYSIPVTLSNPTTSTWSTSQWVLSYRWELPDGTDVTTGGNQLDTALPADVPPGGAVDVNAQVRTPIQSDSGNKRTEYVLRWELRNKVTGQWLSAVEGIGPLDQPVVVEDPTSDELGLEKFYQYTTAPTGSGTSALVNLYAGNSLVEYSPVSNPSRGFATFVRMVYNSMDTSVSSMGHGWSLATSTLTRLGSPLKFHPPGQDWPTTVTYVDGDGTSHEFSLNKHGSTNPALWTYDHPAGVHMFLQRNDAAGDEARAWVMTRPDRTQAYFDDEGYPSANVDKNGNTLTFTWAERRSNNQPTKFLQYITDASGRRTLSLDYYAKGDTYSFIDDTGAKVQATNLTNPKIIDQVKAITDISGRRIELTYTDKGLMAELVDGAGNAKAKTFRFAYEMTQGNKNVKLIKITDPRGNATDLTYFEAPIDPRDKWKVRQLIDRRRGVTGYEYVDPDGTAGSRMRATVTDAEAHATTYEMDGFGRPDTITDAKFRTDRLTWDADNNVVRHVAKNNTTRAWTYDTNTGYPLTITDSKAFAAGTPPTRLTYNTGLGGHIADLIEKTSPEGRRWTFGYDAVGNLTSVTDPKGNATATAGDFTTTHTYDVLGQLRTTTDANDNITRFDDYDPVGYPRLTTDALNQPSRTTYDALGNVIAVTDAKGTTSTHTYDIFSRPLEARIPVDGTRTIVYPAYDYDANDNVVREISPVGAVKTAAYDAADRVIRIDLPKDTATGPARVHTTTYDKVGNVVTETSPKGNLTSTDPNDHVTRFVYDEIYQPVETVDAAGGRTLSVFDEVGNLIRKIGPKKAVTADPDDFDAKLVYDANQQLVEKIDARGHSTKYTYDLDGNVVVTTDQENVRTELIRDERGLVEETRVPHAAGVTRVTRYEYDEVGNPTRTITPRGVETTDDPDDFAQRTVYDKLNRKIEEIFAFDRDDARYNTADKTTYEYDVVGNLTKVSAPPSDRQTVRNDTVYTHFLNGWAKSSTDPHDITTTYSYSDLGQQLSSSVTSAGGSQTRTLNWTYFPDGKLATRSDSGVPFGKHVALVDNSDRQHITATGTWGTSSAGTGYQGFDYRTHAAGTSTDTFRWGLTVPAAGTYEVFVRYAAGTATAAPYTVSHSGGTTVRSVNQTQNAGQWVSIGSYQFAEGISNNVTLGTSTGGTVVADAVKLVRDTTGVVDTEQKKFSYSYDVNGNMNRLVDTSEGAEIDTWSMTHDQLDRTTKVEEFASGALKHTTTFGYDPNSNIVTRTQDQRTATLTYDVRDAVEQVTNTEPGVAQKVSRYTYTPKGMVDLETAANGNTVDYTYALDGLVTRQVEKRADGTVVNDHTIEYTSNSHIAKDIAKTQNADNTSAYLDRTTTYGYDPRDRLIKATRTAVGGGSQLVQDYVLDPNDNTISQTIDGKTTNYEYDRNRLISATAVGGTTSTYNYDPYGRLDTVVAGGQVTEKYTYDGFDRTLSHRAGTGSTAKTTRYTYDPFDRTRSRVEKAGTADEKTTAMSYLGVDSSLASEHVNGSLARTYQYGGQGERLAMVKHTGSVEYSVYGYDTRGNVEVLTNDSGNARATYGYTAYGSPDKDLMTGVDKPDPANPDKEPYNTFRYGAKQLDPATGNYDMGARDYSPGLNRFLSRDLYAGALSDLGLATDPFTMNRYAFGGGNPLSRIEMDGHWGWSDIGHAVLDVAGLVPVVGEVADLANAAWYLAEGNYADAALSAAGAIPFVGWGATAIKTGKNVYKGVDALRSGSKGLDEAADALNASRKADAPTVKDPDQPAPKDQPGSKPADKPAQPAQPAKPPPAPDPAPATRADGPSCPTGNSFTPDTPVVMADGTTKPIAAVRVGDKVLATDPETGRTEARPVIALIIGEGQKDLVEITVDTADSKDEAEEPSGTVLATAGHPFWVAGTGRWTDAKDLRPGDLLRTAAGTYVQVTAVRQFRVTHQRVHNLTVAGFHTYYVLAGSTSLLVHNQRCDIPRTPDGKFAKRNGEQGRDGAADEMNAWDQLEMDGATVVRQETPVSVPGFPVRKYDGTVEINGQWYGIEVKGGTGKRSPEQRAFDEWLNTPGNTATTGDGRTLVGVFDVWIPR